MNTRFWPVFDSLLLQFWSLRSRDAIISKTNLHGKFWTKASAASLKGQRIAVTWISHNFRKFQQYFLKMWFSHRIFLLLAKQGTENERSRRDLQDRMDKHTEIGKSWEPEAARCPDFQNIPRLWPVLVKLRSDAGISLPLQIYEWKADSAQKILPQT